MCTVSHSAYCMHACLSILNKGHSIVIYMASEKVYKNILSLYIGDLLK